MRGYDDMKHKGDMDGSELSHLIDYLRANERVSAFSDILGESWDGGDPWGSAMSEAFAICEWLTMHDVQVPAQLGYRPSLLGVDTDDDEYRCVNEAIEISDITTDELVRYLLDLYEVIVYCDNNGMSY